MKFLISAVIAIVLIGIASLVIFNSRKAPIETPQASMGPIPKNVEKVGDKVKYPQDYTLVLVGDSMTAALGHFDELRKYLGEYYPGKSFEVLNYGFGSTNILSLQKRLSENTFNQREYMPIVDIDYNLILLESFGHNPLSDYALEEGLKKQNEALDLAIKTIRNENPNATLAFVATIAPSVTHYGTGIVDLSKEQRRAWAEERIVYIKNHIKYAEDNNIPVVNIFEKSLVNGKANLDYISGDYIHPSPTGVVFISKHLADFIFENQLLK